MHLEREGRNREEVGDQVMGYYGIVELIKYLRFPSLSLIGCLYDVNQNRDSRRRRGKEEDKWSSGDIEVKVFMEKIKTQIYGL